MPIEKQLRVSIMRNFEFTHCEVKTVEEGKKIIRSLIKVDLANPAITDNSFDLEVYEDNGDGFDWFTWYNDETGNDVSQEMDEEDEEASKK